MTENIYRKTESRFYRVTKIVANIGFTGGFAMQAAGAISDNDYLFRVGTAIFLSSIWYSIGAKEGENQFERASDLEKRLEGNSVIPDQLTSL